jgi:hypothetical protein
MPPDDFLMNAHVYHFSLMPMWVDQRDLNCLIDMIFSFPLVPDHTWWESGGFCVLSIFGSWAFYDSLHLKLDLLTLFR